MRTRTLPRLDELAPEIFLGRVGIVCRTPQREVRGRVLTPESERREMVKFEAVGFGAALA